MVMAGETCPSGDTPSAWRRFTNAWGRCRSSKQRRNYATQYCCPKTKGDKRPPLAATRLSLQGRALPNCAFLKQTVIPTQVSSQRRKKMMENLAMHSEFNTNAGGQFGSAIASLQLRKSEQNANSQHSHTSIRRCRTPRDNKTSRNIIGQYCWCGA